MQHPGKILLEQFMQPREISQNKLARGLSVPTQRVHEIVNGRRSITPDTAMRLSHFFGNSAYFWLELQNRFDLEQAEETGLAAEIGQQVRRLPETLLRRHGGRQRQIEDMSLQVHKLVADKLQKNPQAVLDKARKNIRKWGWDKENRPAPYMIAWQQLLDKPVDRIITIITSPGEKGTLLRSSSPFEGVLVKAEKDKLLKFGKEQHS
ncbi:MAG: HigA family addiction module antidote protein [Deltaproteobacteria bacterium]|nr:HigA family addiction module antidote protein [Deltaproteobacteria bacterium]